MKEKITMMRLNLCSDEVKITKKQLSLEKGILNLKDKHEKSKEWDKFRASKTRKSARKASKN